MGSMEKPWAPSSRLDSEKPGWRLIAKTNEPATDHVLPFFGPFLRGIVGAWTKQTWRGVANIPAGGPAIVVPNHISSLDPVIVGVFLAYNGRWPHFLAKESMFRAPILGALMRGAQQIPVHRGSAKAKDSLVSAKKALEAGQTVVLYPEGTITLDPDEWPMAVHTGAARLAIDTGAPVIPVGQWGANFALPPRKTHRFRFKRWPVTVQAGPVLELADFGHDSHDRDAVIAASVAIADAITAQVEAARGQSAPEMRWHPKQNRRVPRSEAVR